MTMTRGVVFVCLHGSAKSLIAAEHFWDAIVARLPRLLAECQ